MIRWILVLLIMCYVPLANAETSFADRKDVRSYINEVSIRYHFNKKALHQLFANIKIRPKVMQSFSAPLEQKPWYSYQLLFVTEWRIREGVRFWNKYHTALERAEKEYGVPASIIVATIGVETKYGLRTGNFRVMDALSNIAFSDSPRAPYFKRELTEFLLLAREQHFNPLSLKGSYAGAIGQPQFMPSSYRRYAVDFSGNAKIDLSNNEIDVIGSIANYYHKNGWKPDQMVAVPAPIFKNHYLLSVFNNDNHYTINDLSQYGISVRGRLTEMDRVKLIELHNYFSNEYWLGFHNFDVIKRYNNSNLYAMAVYQLSYYINALKERRDHA